MLAIIWEFLKTYYPQITTYLFLVLVTALVVWKVSTFYIKTNQATIKVNSFEPLLKRIEQGLSTLNQVLLEKTVISQSCFSVGNSPRQLNLLGEKLFTNSGAERLFGLIKNELIPKLEEKQFDSLLEMEKECFNVVLEIMNDIRLKEIQNFAFEHPNFEGNPLTYTDILYIISLKLRNEYLEKHPENKLGE